MKHPGSHSALILSFSQILAEDISGLDSSIPAGLILMQRMGKEIYKKSLSSMAHWPENIKQLMSSKLDLQFVPFPTDQHGNVCFADDPTLRPEYRTHFNPIHVFDYYYAMWQVSPLPPSTRVKYSERELQLPRQDVFWDMVGKGEKLRLLHLNDVPPESRFLLHPVGDENQKVKIKQKEARYKSKSKDEKTGKLYLNVVHYVDMVPLITWEYTIEGVQPVIEWFIRNDHKELSLPELEEFLTFLALMGETAKLQQDIRRFI